CKRPRDLAAVLADCRASIRRSDVPRERDRRAHMAEAAELRMRQIDQRPPPAKRPIALDEILDVLHDAGRNAFALQQLDELDVLALASPVRDRPAARQPLEPLDIRIVERADRDPAILAASGIDILQ